VQRARVAGALGALGEAALGALGRREEARGFAVEALALGERTQSRYPIQKSKKVLGALGE
jgi:hypothetical protein